MDALEQELKKLKEAGGHNTTEAALGQVRALALRSTTTNTVLVASLENLADTAAANNHPEAANYKMVLRVCRDSEDLGPLEWINQ